MGILGHGSLLSGMLLFGCKVTGMLFGVIRGGLFVFLYRVGSKCSVPETLESRYERNNNCSATDTSGNESERVLRFVYIDASCPEGEEWCSEKAACSSPLLCLPTTLDRAVYVPQVAPYTPPVDAQAPVLLLIQLPGDSAISPVVPGPHILESWVTGGQVLLGLTSLHSKLYML